MKLNPKLAGLFLAFFAATAAESAVTIQIRNFASATEGNPIVTAAGVPVDQGQAFASAGVFASGVNFSTMSASQVLTFFTSVDNTPVALNATFDGLFSAQDIPNQAYSSGAFAGNAAYIVVGNQATLANSTLIAVYNVGSVFPTPDGVGNAAATFSATGVVGSWVYGISRSVTVQPTVPNAAFTTGIELTSVPEPTVALLGSLGILGLIRRRRR